MAKLTAGGTGFEVWFPSESYDDAPTMNVGSAYCLNDSAAPVVRRAIGFQVRREKPRVRIKAWTQPVLEP